LEEVNWSGKAGVGKREDWGLGRRTGASTPSQSAADRESCLLERRVLQRADGLVLFPENVEVVAEVEDLFAGAVLEPEQINLGTDLDDSVGFDVRAVDEF